MISCHFTEYTFFTPFLSLSTSKRCKYRHNTFFTPTLHFFRCKIQFYTYFTPILLRVESSPGSFDECRLSAGWPPTLWPNQPIWAVSPPKDWQTPSPFIIITQLVSWYSFYHPTEVRGRLSRPRHCSKGAQPVGKAVYRSDCRDKHDRPRWDSNLGPLAPQSGVLPLSHRDLAELHLYKYNFGE